tara:strand:- start:438 stop:629 length:192 start_codon:yes stop_codon:yes gene_type:complete
LIIFGCIGAATVFWSSLFGVVSIYWQLAIYRFIVGVGVGGEYPLAATIAGENSSDAVRGSMIS